ncbi:MAG: acetate/propionate family kinase [Caulobacteraceae bacterium]|nr:acetate/propionate family kinase [Caulobacteraceae bacterium]
MSPSVSGLILALNAGSSTVKCALFEPGVSGAVARTTFEAGDAGSGQDPAPAALAWADQAGAGPGLAAAGHRVVHGGADFHAPVRLTCEVVEALDALTPLAPLHQPRAIRAIRGMFAARPELPQVACFDTAFHRTMPPVAQWLGLPRFLHKRGIRRYGFHGLSYTYIAGRLALLDPALAAGRVVVAHLGSGASLCAMADGRSVDTTMGFSPLDGLLMATRCGAVDPGAVFYLQRHEGLTAAEVEDMLYHRSGLAGVSGVSGDMRALLASDDPAAAEAVELFVHVAAKATAGMAAALGGLDGIVFTGGIGEHSAEIRRRIADRLAWLGLELDEAANRRGGEGPIGARASRVAAWVVPTDEERVIADQTRAALEIRPATPRS